VNRSARSTGRARRLAGLFLITLLGLLIGSGATGSNAESKIERPAADRTAKPLIVGGNASENPGWVAAIVRSSPSGESSLGRLVCTGTLISPRLVLSAGHCVSADFLGASVRPSERRVIVGFERLTRADVSGAEVGVRAIYRPLVSGNSSIDLQRDISLLELNQPVDQETISLVDQGQAPLPGDFLSKFGYGDHSEAGLNPGYLKSARSLVQPQPACYFDLWRGLMADEFGPDSWASFSAFLCHLNYSGVICSGDSGGPGTVFNPALGENYLASVTSIGDCQSYSADIDLANRQISNWIKQTSSALGEVVEFSEPARYSRPGRICRVTPLIGISAARAVRQLRFQACSPILRPDQQGLRQRRLKRSAGLRVARPAGCKQANRARVISRVDRFYRPIVYLRSDARVNIYSLPCSS